MIPDLPRELASPELERVRLSICWVMLTSWPPELFSGACRALTVRVRHSIAGCFRGLAPSAREWVESWRAEHGIYMVGDSRIEH